MEISKKHYTCTAHSRNCISQHSSRVLIYNEVARDWLNDPLATIPIGNGANSSPYREI